MWDILKPCQALFNSVIPNNTSEIPKSTFWFLRLNQWYKLTHN